MNFFDQSAAKQDGPPPPASEDDYGANVVPLKTKGKRKQEGWKSEWHLSEAGAPLPTLYNVMLTLRNHPKLERIVRV